MKAEIAEVVMNPVRQRIIQYLLVHEKGTVKEIKKELSDVPSASLYRHIKILNDSAFIIVVEENRIRGTVENVYSLNREVLEVDDENGTAVQMSLLSLCAAFAKYFSSGHADPRKDLLMLTGCTLTLTDEEFIKFLTELNEVATKYMSIPVTETSVSRQITLVSSPVDL
ncbi:MAG: helix-turn-helix domain-containing protein [Lachnospiraceae bacterium]|nr:helix-turn-helix domain-containing protein [Lachnospiraceae bacterium]